jgi:ankyrin repeat protein
MVARRVLVVLFALGSLAIAQKQRPSLSGVATSAKGGSSSSSSEESLGSQLLSSVIANDIDTAVGLFGGVSAAQAVRLANAIDWRGKSVLMHAASRDFADMVKLLVENKARVDAADYTGGATALMLAARNGSAAAVDALIDAGANVSASTPQGTTVLMQAVANASVTITAALLRQGAEVNAADKGGATALSVAASMGSSAMARLLIAAGASVDAADKQGSTPLLVAAAAGHAETVGALIELGASIDASDSEVMTPLMEAARAIDGFEVANVLIGAKAHRQ